MPLSREDLKKMKPEEINARWPEVARVLAGQPAERPADYIDADDAALGAAAGDDDSWPLVAAELERRGAVRQAAVSAVREALEARKRAAEEPPPDPFAPPRSPNSAGR